MEPPKGRGRGVRVLPEGVWESLQKGDRKDESQEGAEDIKMFDHVDPKNDFGMGLNGTGGRGRGIGRGRGGDDSFGRGIKRDLKGSDWDCSSCGNLNWSWRATCNKCNTSKPVSALADGEVRDGIGGGFNERQERVSAAAVEVDEDGFDDFGRRVKGGRAKDHTAKEQAALERLKLKYGHLMLSTDGSSGLGRFDDAESHVAPHHPLAISSSLPPAERDVHRGDRNRERNQDSGADNNKSGRDEPRVKDDRAGTESYRDEHNRGAEDRGHNQRDRSRDRYERSGDRSRRPRDRDHDRDRRSRDREDMDRDRHRGRY